MAVYYKFKSTKDYDMMPIESQFITFACLRRRIFESKYVEKGTDYDLIISNAQTNEEYVDDNAVIFKNTAVLIRRVPGLPRKPIVVEQVEPKHNKVEENPTLICPVLVDSSTEKCVKEFDWCDFGDDLYSIPEVPLSQSGNLTKDLSLESNSLEQEKIKATPSLWSNRHGKDSHDGKGGFERSMISRIMSGNRIAHVGYERKTPPMGYTCHRCNVPGHFIQHCPTNGDPNYDVRRVEPSTGIPRSMLMVTPDGSDPFSSSAAAILKPNEAAFEEEILGLPSTQHLGDLPPEIRCPLCKEVMKDAVFTRKCCFRSFCDKCIREYIITNSTCVCGTIDVLADDLIPNKTLRDAIIHILISTTTSTITTSTSTDNGRNVVHAPVIESSRRVHSKASSPTHCAASKDDQKASSTGQSLGVVEGTKMKKKKKKVNLQCRATNMQWGDYEDVKSEGYTMLPSEPLARDHYMAQPFGVGTPFTGYPFGPFDCTFDRMLSQNQFADQFRMLSAVLPREPCKLAVNSVGVNWGKPTDTNVFEPWKPDCRNQQKFEQHGHRKRLRDDKEIGSDDGPSAKRSGSCIVSRDRFNDGHSDRGPEESSKRSRSPNGHVDENGCSQKKRQCSSGRMEVEDEEDCHFKRKLSWSSSVISCS